MMILVKFYQDYFHINFIIENTIDNRVFSTLNLNFKQIDVRVTKYLHDIYLSIYFSLNKLIGILKIND